MSMILRYPVLVEVQRDDETMEFVMDKLQQLGFMPRYGVVSVYPYYAFREWFYNENGTYPTHCLLTSDYFDPMADGLSCELCGQDELDMMTKTLLDENVHEVAFDRFMQMLESWSFGR